MPSPDYSSAVLALATVVDSCGKTVASAETADAQAALSTIGTRYSRQTIYLPFISESESHLVCLPAQPESFSPGVGVVAAFEWSGVGRLDRRFSLRFIFFVRLALFRVRRWCQNGFHRQADLLFSRDQSSTLSRRLPGLR